MKILINKYILKKNQLINVHIFTHKAKYKIVADVMFVNGHERISRLPSTCSIFTKIFLAQSKLKTVSQKAEAP